jgi:hypothetical protein
MTTKKSSTKKGDAKPGGLIDPPIVVTGGGGIQLRPSRKGVWIIFIDETGMGRRIKVKSDGILTGVSVIVSGRNAADPPTTLPPARLEGFESYELQITFETEPESKRAASRPSGAKKGKAAGKRSSARK